MLLRASQHKHRGLLGAYTVINLYPAPAAAHYTLLLNVPLHSTCAPLFKSLLFVSYDASLGLIAILKQPKTPIFIGNTLLGKTI